MRLLVLGGGGFLGHHAVTGALAGDRTGDLGALRGGSGDAVLDTYTDPEPGAPAVRATAELLRGTVGTDGYVSGMSVYSPAGPAGMLAAGRGGTYDTVGPGRADRLADVLADCLTAAGGGPGDVELAWTGEDELRRRLEGVEEEQRPLWFPEDQIPQVAIDSGRALGEGLTFRPALDTARDTLAWAPAEGDDLPFERA